MKLSVNVVCRGSAASVYLDLLRAMAAMTVFLYHTRTTFFVYFSNVTYHRAAVAPFYILSSRGYQAVMVFFVLSGYMVGSRVLSDVMNGTWSWRDYLLTRLTRLYVVLIPALLLTMVWVNIDIHVFHVHISSYNFKDFIGTLFFVQEIFTNAFGHNDPLWSLSYEFWYYILFPALIMMVASKSWRGKILSGAVSAVIVIFTWGSILAYFSIWLLGAVVSLIPKVEHTSAFQRQVAMTVAVLFCVGILTFTAQWAPFVTRFYPFDVLIGLSSALLVLMIIGLEADQQSRLTFPKPWANFSYTLYLTHFPPNITVSYLIGVHSWQPTIRNLFIYFAVDGLMLIYAWGVASFTELKTTEIRAWLSRVAFGDRSRVRSVET